MAWRSSKPAVGGVQFIEDLARPSSSPVEPGCRARTSAIFAGCSGEMQAHARSSSLKGPRQSFLPDDAHRAAEIIRQADIVIGIAIIMADHSMSCRCLRQAGEAPTAQVDHEFDEARRTICGTRFSSAGGRRHLMLFSTDRPRTDCRFPTACQQRQRSSDLKWRKDSTPKLPWSIATPLDHAGMDRSADPSVLFVTNFVFPYYRRLVRRNHHQQHRVPVGGAV